MWPTSLLLALLALAASGGEWIDTGKEPGTGAARERGGASRPEQRAAPPPARPRIAWRDSIALGAPERGSLVRGVRLPAQGSSYFTWDPVLKRQPNRDWRRWGTAELVRTTLRVLRGFRRTHPGAPRLGVGDLSLPEGGYFGPEVSGGIGHATHQNGLDVDVYYPRIDRRERLPDSPDEIDHALAQDLVDRFVAAGAEVIYVGPSTGLAGPAGIVEELVNHDNHLHFRLSEATVR